MPIRYRCPACQQLLGISSKMAGREFPCPTCGAVSIVPLEDQPVLPPRAEGPPVTFSSAPADDESPPEGFEEPLPPASDDVASRFEETFAPEFSEAAAQADESASESEEDDGGFSIQSRRAPEEEMDLTPMVDMTFLLLIFFMITASFSVQKSIAFPPPTPDQKGAAQTLQTLEDLETSSVIVRVDDRNVIYVDDEPLADPRRLVDVLRAALSAQRNELVLTADDNALHETVVTVIDAATAAGMQKIRMGVAALE
ncbi:MAG: ExbD/TolR family protein [Planctomycetales bacterium]